MCRPLLPIFLSVSLSVTRLHSQLWCARVAERIELLFGVKTLGAVPRTLCSDPPQQMGGKSSFSTAFAKLLWRFFALQALVLFL